MGAYVIGLIHQQFSVKAFNVRSNNVNTIKQVKGIGAKTAERVVLELKDKVRKLLWFCNYGYEFFDNALRENHSSEGGMIPPF